MKKLFFITAFLCQSVYGQNFSFTDELSFGGSLTDVLDVKPDASGTGFYFYGSSNSDNTIDHLSANYGGSDYWLIRTDLDYNILWEVSFGGTGSDTGLDLVVTDTHVYFVGTSDSPISGNKTIDPFGSKDVWLLKLTHDGTIVWQQTYGGTGFESSVEMAMYQGNIILYTISFSSNSGNMTTVNQGDTDCWIVNVDPNNGTINDQAMFGSSSTEEMGAIEIFDDRILIIANSYGDDGDIPVVEPGFNTDIILFELNTNLDIVETKGFGGNDTDIGRRLIKKSPNEYFLVGYSASSISGSKSSDPFGFDDVWVIKLDANLNLVWDTIYGGSNFDLATDAAHIDDNGSLVILAVSSSPSGTGNKSASLHGFDDFWPIVINTNTGALMAEFSFGGDDTDYPVGMLPLGNGNLLLVGLTDSGISGNKSVPVKGVSDTWVIETDASAFLKVSELSKDNDFQFYPNPTNQSVTLSLNEGADYQEVQFFTVDGRVISKMEIPSGTKEMNFDFLNTPAGIIVYEILGAKSVQTGRLVKAK